jgi:RiboL-PSP-HEPN
MVVSALDQYIHEKVRQEMLNTKNKARPMTGAYQRFAVSLKTVDRALSSPQSDEWLDDEIRSRHGLRSFQKSDKIREAALLISDDNLWLLISQEVGIDIKSIRTQLDLIVDRRNQIAHEADLDPGNPGARWPISHTDVQRSVDFIESIVEAAEKRL